tara:strand:- start:403 stop:564 length:162 start_codon:yes stop_codon:yes gene_type:complete
MVVSVDFQVYVSSHSFGDSFLYNNRLFSSRLISSDEYNCNRDFVLKERSEQAK